jgi:transcriptional regulator with XRE-family HTH domain
MKAFREAQGLSQTAAAETARMSQPQWSRMEAGELTPRLDDILGIQHALGVDSLEDFFGLAPTRALLEEG